MVHNPEEWNRDKLAYELYRRLPYTQKTIKEIVGAFLELLHEKMLDKTAIRLYKIGTLFPRVKRIKRKPGWSGIAYDVDKLRYFFQASYTLARELEEIQRRDDDNSEGGAS